MKAKTTMTKRPSKMTADEFRTYVKQAEDEKARQARERAARREYAKVVWTVEDVQTLREDLTDAQAEAFLERNSRRLQDRLIEEGWDVLGVLLDDDDEIPAAGEAGE